MVEPISIFTFRSSTVYCSLVNSDDYYPITVEHKGYDKACFGDYYKEYHKQHVKRLACKLGKYSQKPMAARVKFLEDIILGVAKNGFDSNNPSMAVVLSKHSDGTLRYAPYNIVARVGALTMEPVELTLSRTGRNWNTGKVDKRLDFKVKVTIEDADYDSCHNKLSNAFTADVFMEIENDGDTCGLRYVHFNNPCAIGVTQSHLFHALIATLQRGNSEKTSISMFKAEERRDERCQCHRDVISSALIHCTQFKDRQKEFEEFFKVDPDADEANLNGSL